MSEGDQWRFQWPDGTWIRWNPHTQSWEKESDLSELEAVAPVPAVPEVEHAEPNPERAIAEQPVEGGAAEPEYRVAVRPRPSRRPGVSDVIPPTEPEEVRGRLWPTILAGAVVGVAAGVAISFVIR